MTTTDITQLKQGEPFVWGLIIRFHEIGPYTIAEFHPWKRKNSEVLTGIPDTDTTEFHTWVNGKDCHEAYLTLDEAIAGAIAYKAEGPNHRANVYFIRSLIVPPIAN